MKNQKHKELMDEYDIHKSKHLERLATKALKADEKYQKLKGKPLKGNF